ncbi:MAG TPA: M56 family metallopeptidase [Holophagaceae bacterium]|nr:M56 family metallopeptidase [Holophagaceae bacterium]
MSAFHHPAVLALAWTLLHFLWQGALLGLVAWVGLALLARRSPQARYAWACGILSLMALAPVITFLVLRQAGAAAPSAPVESTALLQASAWIRLQAALQPWLPALSLGWLAGVGLFALRLAGGFVMIQRLKEVGTSPVPSQWHLVLARLCRDLRLRRTVRLLASARVDVPMVVGWLRPVILLPAAALTQLTPHQLEAILAHELAHVRRHDFAVNLLQACVEALLFYHPAVWWLSSKVREERELACDDVAVSLCGDALAYAQALAVLDDLRSPLPTLALASHGGSLMKRITRLVQPQLLPNPTLRSALLTALAATALSAAGIALQEGKKVEKKRTVTVQTLDDGRQLSIKGEGDIQVKPDEKEPLVLAPGARMRIAEKKDGKARRLDVTPEKKTYTVDGQEKPFDAEAETWLRDTLKASEKAKADAKAKGEGQARRIEMQVTEDGGKRHVIRKENGEVVEDLLVEVPEVKVTEEGPNKQRIIVKKGGKVVQDEVIEHPDVQVIETKEGGRKIVVKKDGKVVSEDELPDVKMTDEKGGARHIVVKKGGKVVEDRLIEIPEVKVTEEKDGSQRIIVRKSGKVVEDHKIPGPKAFTLHMKHPGGEPFMIDSEGGPDFFWESDDFAGDRPMAWRIEGPAREFPRGPMPRMNQDEVRKLRSQVDQLRKQVEDLQRQLGQGTPAPKAGKSPKAAPAPGTPAPSKPN